MVHEGLGDYISYLFGIIVFAYSGSVLLDRLVLTVEGANDGQPQELRYDVSSGTFSGELGLHEAGQKKILSLVLHYADGTTVDLTDALIDALSGEVIDVRFPQEDVFGTCPPP